MAAFQIGAALAKDLFPAVGPQGAATLQRNLQAFVKEIIATLTPEVAIRYINPLELINRAAASYNIDPNNLVRTEEQVLENERQAQMAALAQHLGPGAQASGRHGAITNGPSRGCGMSGKNVPVAIDSPKLLYIIICVRCSDR